MGKITSGNIEENELSTFLKAVSHTYGNDYVSSISSFIVVKCDISLFLHVS